MTNIELGTETGAPSTPSAPQLLLPESWASFLTIRDQDKEDAVAVVEPGPLHAAPQEVELVTEHEVLQGEACPVSGKGAD